MKVMKMSKYICLFNPHSEEWLLFDYVEDKVPYAPNYGTPLCSGPTPQECIDAFGVSESEVEIA